MTAVPTPTLSVSEAALLLRVKLGPLRSWRDFLTDNIRGQQSIGGHTLLPCAQRHDGRSYRPVYAVADVKDFIAKVLAAIPGAGRAPIKTVTLAIDRRRNWRVNRFDKDGALVAGMRSAICTV